MRRSREPREKISENTCVPVALTARERELILEHTFAGDELLAPVQVLPEVGRHAAEYTLYDIEELQGFVAAEANHTDDAVSRRNSVHSMNVSSEKWRSTTTGIGRLRRT